MRVERNPRAAGRVIGEAAFVVTPDDSKLHTLNKTGAAIWAAAEHARTVDELTEVVCRRFDVAAATARADVARFVDDLVARQILVPATGEAPRR